MERIVLWYSIGNGEDGSAEVIWFLSEKSAEKHQEDEGWGEICIGSVETFVGSDIHEEAVENEDDYSSDDEEEDDEDIESLDDEEEY